MPNIRNIAITSFIIASGCLGFGISEFLKARRALDWPHVAGIVVSSSIGDRRYYHGGKEMVSYHPLVSYRYAVDGQEYRGSRIKVHDKGGSRGWAKLMTDRYAEGVGVEVYFDPDHPKSAVLEPGAHFGPHLLFLFGFGIVFGSIFVWILVLLRRSR
jgi:hypothetical protein